MDDMRSQILSELIDKMHGRIADKMYPDEKPADAAPTDAPTEEHTDIVLAEPADDKDDDDMSDSDIDEILKSC